MSDEKRFTLRMDQELFDRIQRIAEKNKRSVAKQIEYILQQQIDGLNDNEDGPMSPDTPERK